MHIRNPIARSLFSSLAFVLFVRSRAAVFSISFATLSLLAEMKLGWPGVFSASGAVISTAGLFLNIKHSLHFHLNRTKESFFYEFSGMAVLGSAPPESDLKKVDEVLIDELFGVTFMVAGTLIWAYGGYFVAALQAMK